MATFTVAAIAKEPWPILERFVRWHLDQGADRLILYLDDPNDPSLPRLHGDPRIEPRPCTPALWAGLGMAPDARFTRRQRGVELRATGPETNLIIGRFFSVRLRRRKADRIIENRIRAAR